ARARGHHGRRRAGEVLLAHPAGDVGRDVAKDAADRAVRSGRHQRLAVAAAEADARVQGDRSEEGDVVRLGQATSAAAAADVCRLPAVRALDAAAHVGQRDVLRRGDDHRAGHGHALRQAQLHIARTRRQVDDEVVELAPFHLVEELAEPLGEHRPAPDHRLARLEDGPERHHLDAVRAQRPDALRFTWLRLRRDAHHDRHVGAVDVVVEETDASAGEAERDGRVDADRGLAHASLARADSEDVAHALDLLPPGQATRRCDVGIPADLDCRNAGDGADHCCLDGAADLVLQWARGRGEDNAHERGGGIDAEISEHPQLEHRPAQLRVDDGGERLLEGSRRRGVTHRPRVWQSPEHGRPAALEWRVMLTRDVLRDLERQVGTSHLYTRPADLAAYAYDAYGASGLRRVAGAIVFPGSTDEVAGVVAVCARHGVAVVPRGAGTGYAGGAAADGGVILNLCRMTRVGALELEAQRL